MNNFLSRIVNYISKLECKIDYRFSESEMNEILKSAKPQNLPFVKILTNMKKLSAFDISLIVSRNNLNLDKIKVIQYVVNSCKENEFTEHGQTLSDFISKICANLDIINSENIDYFKEIALLKSELYDFTKFLKHPTLNTKKHENYQFAFEKILID